MLMSVKDNVKQFLKDFKHIPKEVIPAAVVASLNRTGTALSRAVRKEMIKKLNITEKQARRYINEKRVRFQKRDRATRSRWISKVYTNLHNFPAYKIGNATQGAKGASSGAGFFPGSFIADVAAGKHGATHTGIFVRKTKKPTRIGRSFRGKKSTLKIKEVTVPIHMEIMSIGTQKLNEVQSVFVKSLDSEMAKRLKRMGF